MRLKAVLSRPGARVRRVCFRFQGGAAELTGSDETRDETLVDMRPVRRIVPGIARHLFELP